MSSDLKTVRLFDLDGAIFRDNDHPERGIGKNIDELIRATEGIYWKKIRHPGRLAFIRTELLFKGWPAEKEHFLKVVIEYYKKQLGRDVISKIAEIKLYESAKI